MTTINKEPCECGNCDWTGTLADIQIDLEHAPNLAERLNAGATVPAGECPECGCFAYLVPTEEQQAFVMWGSNMDGFEFVGPFDDVITAFKWGEIHAPKNVGWQSVSMKTPAQYERK